MGQGVFRNLNDSVSAAAFNSVISSTAPSVYTTASTLT